MVLVNRYTVPLAEGWNLISFPGTPAQSDLSSVFPRGCGVGVVLAYRNGDWETAVQEENGLWRGKLNAVQAGYGYWVRASQHTSLAIGPLVPSSSASLPNVVRLVQGWNLIGVLDAELRPFGEVTDAYSLDSYLQGIPWRVAYGFSTVPAGWIKATPGDGSPVWAGFGYWLWVGNSTADVPSEPPSDFMGVGREASLLDSGFPAMN